MARDRPYTRGTPRTRAIGNGDIQQGQQNLFMLARRLEEARQKHPAWGEGAVEALAVIGEEYNELGRAVA